MSDFQIDISDQQTHLEVRTERLQEVVERVLCEEGFERGEVSIAVVDDAAIHRVNRDFLGHDYPTDVVSFALGHESRAIDGELVVSAETAVREAVSHGWSAEDELLLYVVHGVLHLCGYDDLTDEARPIMRNRERQLLAFWQLTPTGLEA